MDAPQYYPNGVPIPQVANQQRQQSIINCAQKCINSNKNKKNGRKCLDNCVTRSSGGKHKKSRKNKSRKGKSRKGKSRKGKSRKSIKTYKR